jgi:hypothetical protein
VNWLEILRLALKYLHLVGFALLFGGFVAQYATRRFRVDVVMRTGLGTMFLTGFLLAIPFPSGTHLDYLKLGVKLAIAVVIGALFGVSVTRERRGAPVPRGLFLTIGGLILLTAGVAVFWH